MHFSANYREKYFWMFPDRHGDPFIFLQSIFIVRFSFLLFDKHVIAIVFESESSQFGGEDGDSSTRFDGINEQSRDGDSHGSLERNENEKARRWRRLKGCIVEPFIKVHPRTGRGSPVDSAAADDDADKSSSRAIHLN